MLVHLFPLQSNVSYTQDYQSPPLIYVEQQALLQTMMTTLYYASSYTI